VTIISYRLYVEGLSPLGMRMVWTSVEIVFSGHVTWMHLLMLYPMECYGQHCDRVVGPATILWGSAVLGAVEAF
jgi:hypothetical protein